MIVTAAALAAVMTYPLAFKATHVGRINSGDGQLSIWNVAWVAHALGSAPSRLFQANIFHPHRDTLAFSESNIGAGVLGAPAYWLTRNPFLAHNIAVLIGFTLSAAGIYLLVRHLTGHRGAATVSAIAFAYCPYIFARTAHVQLLMTAGLPFVLLAFHRLVDAPAPGRAIALAVALVAQALSCAYYGVFAVGLVGVGTFYYARHGRRWRDQRYWAMLALAAVVSLLLVAPFVLPYLRLQRETGFGRSLDEAYVYSAGWREYLASAAWAHRWMLARLGAWNEVLFPGFIATILGAGGLALALVTRRGAAPPWPRFYAIILGLALWMSLGPAAGLYDLTYRIVPVFSFLRAPSRFGVLVTLALVVLMAFALTRLAGRFKLPARVFAALAIVACLELATMPLDLREAPPLPDTYRVLASLRRGPVVELPFYFNPIDFHRHSIYMLNSTSHWFPLVNGYSDYIPTDFREMAVKLSSFPTVESFGLLEKRRVRYAIFHLDLYDHRSREQLFERLDRYRDFLQPLFRRGNVWMYEIVQWPVDR